METFQKGFDMGNLVLTRRKNEVVMIGANVAVKVVEVRGDKVRLMFIAPPQVPIHRGEVFDIIQAGPEPIRTVWGTF